MPLTSQSEIFQFELRSLKFVVCLTRLRCYLIRFNMISSDCTMKSCKVYYSDILHDTFTSLPLLATLLRITLEE